MAEVKFSSFAEADLENIFSYFAKYNINSARKLLLELKQKFQLLANNPKLGRTHDDFILNLRSFPYKNFVIFYFQIENGVEIYRVLHGSRDIDSLFEDFFAGLKP